MPTRVAFVQKGIFEKISVHYLAGALSTAGFECRVFIEDIEDNFIEAVASYNPDYCAASLFIGEEEEIFSELSRLKKRIPNMRTIVGGPFALIFPDIVLRIEVDYLLMGDAENTFPELLRRIESGMDIDSIPGLRYIKRTGVLFSNDTFHLSSLHEIQPPDRDLYYRYRELRDRPTKIFIGSRGCPYRCTYCYNTELSKHFLTSYWRVRPVQQVISEVRYVAQTYGLSWVHFQDGTFNANQSWLTEFLEAYGESGLPPFMCNCRVENITEDLVVRMRRAGCDRITFGIQSGSERIRRELAGRSMSNEQIIQACKICMDNSIRVGVDIIFGWPGETLEEAMETIELCRKINVETYSSNVLIFYPELRITRFAVENDFIERAPTLEDLQLQTPNDSPLTSADKNMLINMDKLFYYLVRHPALQPIIMYLLRCKPNSFFYMLKNIHLLVRSMKYDTNMTKFNLIKNYILSCQKGLRKGC